MSHALIVNDEVDSASMLAALVADEKFTVATAHTLRDARRQIALQTPDIVLLDLQLPDGSGLDLFDNAALLAQSQVVLITGHASLETSIQALRVGAADYLVKPIAPAQLRAILSRVMPPSALRAEIDGLEAEWSQSGRFGHLWGRSAPMQRVYHQIARVAGTAVSVLITGESGTGKELVARTLHDLSRRRKQPFLAVNCGAISPQPDRERALRPREGQLHRRRPPAPGLFRARPRRHAVPGRDHRDAARAAGQAAARARDRHLHARRLDDAAERRRARRRRHQPRPGARGRAKGSCARTCSTA